MKDNKYITLKKSGFILFILLFLCVMYAKLVSDGYLFGYRTTFVLTGSMEPEIPVFSLLIEKRHEEGSVVQVGDVITFSVHEDGFSKRVTHRVIRIEDERIFTKGDANSEEDDWRISLADVEGKVIFVFPYTLWVVAGVVILVVNGVLFKRRFAKKNKIIIKKTR